MRDMNISSLRGFRGFSLIELLISIAIGLFITAVLLALFGNTIRSNRDVLASVRLNQELNAVMRLMVDDVRRAGYSDGNLAVYLNGATPDLTLPAAGCVLYSYDRDDSDVIDNDERFGFRLTNGVVQMRTSGAAMTSCTDANDTWESLTDSNAVTVTGLAFTTTGSKCRNVIEGHYYTVDVANSTSFACDNPVTDANVSYCEYDFDTNTHDCTASFDDPDAGDRVIDTRQVNITLAGESAGDSDVTKTLNGTVKVRNNRVRVY